MIEITLTEEQRRLLETAHGPISIVGPDGVVIGVYEPVRAHLSGEELDEIRTRMADSHPEWLSTESLLERARS